VPVELCTEQNMMHTYSVTAMKLKAEFKNPITHLTSLQKMYPKCLFMHLQDCSEIKQNRLFEKNNLNKKTNLNLFPHSLVFRQTPEFSFICTHIFPVSMLKDCFIH
jgi:hypothetical protein